MVLGQQHNSAANPYNNKTTNKLSTTKFVILALLICVAVVIICLASYIIRRPSVRSIGLGAHMLYTHCSQKPLNLPHRNAFVMLGIKFISPDKIINLAQQPGPEPLKIIYIPCSYNISDTDIRDFLGNRKLLASGSNRNLRLDGSKIQWITAAVLGCNKLCAKNGLWTVLESTYGRRDAAEITPESWVIPAQTPAIRRLCGKSNMGTKDSKVPALIFKKNIQGKQGLLLTNSPGEIQRLLGDSAEHNDKYLVAQRYIDRPYLINGRKLNIRLYVLVVVNGPGSSWWLYRAGKCIYTNRIYQPLPAGTTIRSGASDQMDLLEQHFTSLNLDSEKVYRDERCPENLDELQEYMQHRGENWPQIWEKIQLGLQKVARAYTNKLTAYQGSVAYQIFGVDYILTRTTDVGAAATDITPYLLEFNKGPEMKYKSPRDPELKQGLQKDILELVLDRELGQDGAHADKWLLLNSVNKSKTGKFLVQTPRK